MMEVEQPLSSKYAVRVVDESPKEFIEVRAW